MQQFSGRERLGVAAAGAIVLFLGAGGWAFSHSNAPATAKPSIAATAFRPTGANGAPAALEIAAGGVDAAAPATNAATTVAATTGVPPVSGGAPIFVHVAGAVKNPGVYKFVNGDRINDAVKAAGGFQSTADRDALNLADTLQDADQIFIPTADKGDSGAIANPPATPGHPSSVRKSRSRRMRALVVPGTAPSRGRDIPVMPIPAPPAPGDIVIQPLPTPPRGGVEQYPHLAGVVTAPIAAITPIVPRRGRVIGRVAPVILANPDDSGATPATDDADDNGAVTPVASGYASARKSSVSKKSSAAKSSGSASKSGTKFKNPGDGVVHLNSATAEQLEKLPGVGPAMSARIVEYRAEIGKFSDPSQLTDVKGIGDKKYAKMQPFLAL